MRRLLSFDFWMQTFVSTLMTMIMIYIIKSMFKKVNIPVVSDMMQQV